MDKLSSDTKLNPLLAFLVRTLLRPRVYYLDPERKDEVLSEPSILVCNHTGHLDGGVINTAFLPQRIHTLAAKDRFEQRGFGFFLRHTGCIPIDRQHADTSWIHDSLKTLHNDHEHVAIYPEGRHGEHRRQLPFHPGVTMLTTMANVPLVLVYLDGPVRFFRRNKIMVAPPFRLEPPTEGMTSEYITKQTHLLEEKMKDLMDAFINLTETPDQVRGDGISRRG